jgi:hypothetical protein
MNQREQRGDLIRPAMSASQPGMTGSRHTAAA